MTINIHVLVKKFILLFPILCCMISLSADAAITNPIDKEPPIALEMIFQNRSILKCGAVQDETILTLLDVQILLAISNFMSKNPVPITTNWNNFRDPKINLYRLSNQIPQDVLRVLFLCLNWQDTKLANLFVVSDAERKSHLQKLRENKPWKMYSDETQRQINSLSDAYLEELLDIVLRANLAEPVRGDLKTNQLLKSVKFIWLL